MWKAALVSIAVTGLLAGCAGSDEESVTGSAAGAGASIAQQAGCASCHGSGWQGGVGPGWVGLAGSTVELADGSVVVADEDYLFESIRDPSARRVDGFAVLMPPNSLSDDEIRAVVEYIKTLPGDR